MKKNQSTGLRRSERWSRTGYDRSEGFPTNVYQSFTKEVKGAGTILEGLSADEAVKAIMDKLEAKFII